MRRPKPFDIKHPTREMDIVFAMPVLRDLRLESMYRGRVKNEKVIILTKVTGIDFVYEDSISVQLQPIGAHQDMYRQEVGTSEKIYLQARGGMPINCFYPCLR